MPVPEVPDDAEIVQPEHDDNDQMDDEIPIVQERQYKTKERARVLSSAYHKSRLAAQKLGKSKDEAKKMARAAHAAAAKKYDEEHA